jgi:hypothetical protein
MDPLYTGPVALLDKTWREATCRADERFCEQPVNVPAYRHRMPNPQTIIVVKHARKIANDDWIVDQVQIQFPDGSYGASGVRAGSKADAERLAVSKATDRRLRIIEGTLAPSHLKKPKKTTAKKATA